MLVQLVRPLGRLQARHLLHQDPSLPTHLPRVFGEGSGDHGDERVLGRRGSVLESVVEDEEALSVEGTEESGREGG